VTNDAALEWCAKHSLIVIFHPGKIVLVVPYKKVDVEAFKKRGFKIEITDGGYAMAHSDPGDELKDVVEAARTVWRANVSGIDATLDTLNGTGFTPIKFGFKTDM
jgi:hypothetical protein